MARKNMNELEDDASHIHFYSDDIPELITKYLNKVEWQTVLDVGCGDGRLLFALDRGGFLAGKNVYAMDLSPARVERVKLLGLDVECFVENACDMSSIGDGLVDVLVTTQVIEHVPDDARMIQEISRVLREGGIYYLNTVFKKWYGWYYHRHNGKWVIESTHVREYKRDSQLLEILEANKLEVLESRKILAWYSILDFILHRVGATGWAYNNRLLTLLRKIKVPIPGYYNWEIVGVRNLS